MPRLTADDASTLLVEIAYAYGPPQHPEGPRPDDGARRLGWTDRTDAGRLLTSSGLVSA